MWWMMPLLQEEEKPESESDLPVLFHLMFISHTLQCHDHTDYFVECGCYWRIENSQFEIKFHLDLQLEKDVQKDRDCLWLPRHWRVNILERSKRSVGGLVGAMGGPWIPPNPNFHISWSQTAPKCSSAPANSALCLCQAWCSYYASPLQLLLRIVRWLHSWYWSIPPPPAVVYFFSSRCHFKHRKR